MIATLVLQYAILGIGYVLGLCDVWFVSDPICTLPCLMLKALLFKWILFFIFFMRLHSWSRGLGRFCVLTQLWVVFIIAYGFRVLCEPSKYFVLVIVRFAFFLFSFFLIFRILLGLSKK